MIMLYFSSTEALPISLSQSISPNSFFLLNQSTLLLKKLKSPEVYSDFVVGPVT